MDDAMVPEFPVPQTLCCPLCQRLYHDAVTSTKCGHSFCQACVTREASSNLQAVVMCPNDGSSTELESFVSNLALQQQVDAFPCPCQHENCSLKVGWIDYSTHLLECYHRPLACPNSSDCGVLLQGEMTDHLKQCAEAECCYSVIGCPFKGLLKDKLYHEASCSFGSDPKEIVIHQQIERMVGIVADLQQQYQSLQSRVSTASQELQNIEEDLANQRRKAVEFEMPFKFQCMGSFKGHGAAVWALASLNNTLFTASADESIKCWDLSRMACVRTLKGHQGVVHSLAVGGGKLFSGDSKGKILAWDPVSFKQLQGVTATKNILSCMQASKKRLFVATFNELLVYKTNDLSLLAKFTDFDFHWVRALLLHSSGHLYIAYANHVQVRDFRTLSVLTDIKTEYGSIRSLTVTDSYLVLGTVNQNIQVYDLVTLSRSFQLSMHLGAINSLTISAEGKYLFSGSDDGKPALMVCNIQSADLSLHTGTVNIWSFEKRLVIQTLQQPEGPPIHALAWHKGLLLAAGDDNQIKLYRYQKLEQPEQK
eukprot:m.176203 g.176203  ORF g.176203 m.176203 type:complete len:537 (+) comp16795_c0_seq15:72-1682(+)